MASRLLRNQARSSVSHSCAWHSPRRGPRPGSNRFDALRACSTRALHLDCTQSSPLFFLPPPPIMSDTHYQTLGYSSALEKQQRRSRRSKIIVSCVALCLVFVTLPILKVITSLVVLVAVIAIGVTVGVVVSKNHSKPKSLSTSSGSSSDSSGSGSTSSGGGSSSSNDPSNFQKDTRLKKSLYGLAYTPEGSLPDYGCSSTLGWSCHALSS